MKIEAILRSVLSDILNGYSFCKDVYIKHLRLDDYVDYETKYDEYFKYLQKKGMETEEVLLKRAIKQGLWSTFQQDDLNYKEDYLTLLQKSYDGIPNPDMKAEHQKNIDKTKKELALLKNIRGALIQHSCEKKTEEKLNHYYVIESLFKNKELSQPYLTEEEKDDIDTDFAPLIYLYNEVMQKISIDNIRRIAIDNRFRKSWQLSGNAYYYFGVPICNLTFHQQDLATSANDFEYIFNEFPTLTSEKDPQKIIDSYNLYKTANQKGKEGKSIMAMSDSEKRRMNLPVNRDVSKYEKALEKRNSKK